MNMKPTNVTKKEYLDITEKVFDADSVFIEKFLGFPDDEFLYIAYRTSAMIAYLVSSGRRPELLGLWQRVTEKAINSTRNFQDSRFRNYGIIDLNLEDLCISFMLMKEYVKEEWMDVLREIKPDTHFSFMKKENVHNMMAYGLVGMYLRYKLTGEPYEEHFDLIMPWLMERFDENGMWDDVDHAIIYDLTTRVRFEQLLWYGYDGKWAKPIDDALNRSAELTLKMQSATYETPYGGRSNQYLFNEALQVALCEFEAIRHKKIGDLEKAGQFKRAAHLSALTIWRYLNLPGGSKHIKNMFPQDSLYGIDPYGSFPRYITEVAAFIAYGYLAADDEIEEHICPVENGGYVFATSDCFGKVFAAAAGQSVEYAIYAEPGHDTLGLGRYHAVGIPSELCLSTPFAENPSYLLSQNRVSFDVLGLHRLDGTPLWSHDIATKNFAISSGYVDEFGKRHFLFEQETPCYVQILEESIKRVSFCVAWDSAVETISVDENGVHASCELNEKIEGTAFWAIPLLVFNGKEETTIEHKANNICVHYGEFEHRITSNEVFTVSDSVCGNRNGIYRIAFVDTTSTNCTITMKLS